jgi:glycosyltransferase involved in cell wall biosynthesis
MHVAHVLRKYNPAQWGGTETVILQLLDGLRAQEVSGSIYAPKLEQTGQSDPLRDAGHKVKRYRAVVPVLNLSEEQRNQLVAVGGNLMSFDLPARLLTERGVSVIHTHALNRIGGIALTAAKMRKIPLVVTIHGGVLDLPKSVQQTLSAPLEGGVELGKIFGAVF